MNSNATDYKVSCVVINKVVKWHGKGLRKNKQAFIVYFNYKGKVYEKRSYSLYHSCIIGERITLLKYSFFEEFNVFLTPGSEWFSKLFYCISFVCGFCALFTFCCDYLLITDIERMINSAAARMRKDKE